MRKIYFYFFSLILFAGLLTIKVSNIIGYSVTPSQVGFVSDLSAKEEGDEAKPAEETKDSPKEEKPAEAKPAEGGEEKKEGEAKEGEGEKKEGEKKPEKEKELVASTEKPKSIDLTKQDFSPAEIDLLQNLAKRREQLDKWNQDIITRENVLSAATEKVNGKIKELNSLKLEVGHLLFQYNQKEEEKIASLVKIYQNMKPKEAAAIFEQLDMPILLEVVTKMKEANAALILAQMDPTKAKELTIQLALQKRLPPMADPQPEAGTDAAANDSGAPVPAADGTTPAAATDPSAAAPSPAAAADGGSAAAPAPSTAADTKPADAVPPADSKAPDTKPSDAKPADSKDEDKDKPATPESPPAAEPPK